MPRYRPEFCPYCGAALQYEDPPAHCEDCGEFVVQQPVTAVETLVVDGEAVLLQKRDAGRRRGTWGFPGGHVEFGEPPWVAAARELTEETGLTVDPADLSLFDATYSVNDDGSHYLVLAFAVPRERTAGELDGGDDETAALRFLTPGDLEDEQELFFPEYGARIDRARAHVSADRPDEGWGSTLDLR